jgi:hypothetical protein
MNNTYNYNRIIGLCNATTIHQLTKASKFDFANRQNVPSANRTCA